MLPVNEPKPEPAKVTLPEVRGADAVPQQIPLAVTTAPPSEVMLPPLNAEEVVIEVATLVVSEGAYTVETGDGGGDGGVMDEGSFFLQETIRIMTQIM